MRWSQCGDNFIHWCGVVPQSKENPKDSLSSLAYPFPWIMSKLHSIFGIKQKLSIYSFYSLSLRPLLYITIPSKNKPPKLLDFSHKKVLSYLSTFPVFQPLFSPSSCTSLHAASLVLSKENNSGLIVLGWHNGPVYTAGGLSTYHRSHLCWVGLVLIEISSTNTSPALVWGICCVISQLKQTTLLSSFEERWENCYSNNGNLSCLWP